jgi:hypothetical protein
MIDDHMLTLAAAGRPPATMALRRVQLVRMARDIGGHPADVTGQQLVEWFGSQTGWTTETRRRYLAERFAHQPVNVKPALHTMIRQHHRFQLVMLHRRSLPTPMPISLCR